MTDDMMYLKDEYVGSCLCKIMKCLIYKGHGKSQRVRKGKHSFKTCVPFQELLNLGNFYAFFF